MLAGCVKALESLSSEVLKEVLFPLIQSIWSQLSFILQVYSSDPEIVADMCSLYQKILKTLPQEIAPHFSGLAKLLLESFSANAANVKCLRIFSYGCA